MESPLLPEPGLPELLPLDGWHLEVVVVLLLEDVALPLLRLAPVDVLDHLRPVHLGRPLHFRLGYTQSDLLLDDFSVLNSEFLFCGVVLITNDFSFLLSTDASLKLIHPLHVDGLGFLIELRFLGVITYHILTICDWFRLWWYMSIKYSDGSLIFTMSLNNAGTSPWNPLSCPQPSTCYAISS